MHILIKNNQIIPRPSRGYFGQIQKNVGTHQIYKAWFKKENLK